jgi:predicted dehydrogenase
MSSGSSGADVAVGFVGLGTIAETHLAVLADVPRVRLAFVVDRDPSATVAFRDEAPPRYERLDEALGVHQPDLVVVATPTGTHAELARQALTGSAARVLVEKPLVHDLAALDELRSLEPRVDLSARVFVAHHFAFSPEVRWAADLIAARPEWGPVTRIVTVFHDPYLVDADHSFAAYTSSWVDSGVNQLSMLARFVEVTDRGPLHESSGGASSWCTATFRSGGDGATGTALLRTSWEAVASSKRTTVHLDRSGVEIWLDQTAVTAIALRDGAVVDQLTNDGRTPRKIAHYRPLYESLLSATPDPVLGFATAERVLRLLYR